MGWKALLRILRVCLSRDPSLVKESVNLSGPLMNIVLNDKEQQQEQEEEEEETINENKNSGKDDMIDATLDALMVLQLLLNSDKNTVEGVKVAVSDIFNNHVTTLSNIIGKVQLNHSSVLVRNATSCFVKSLAAAGGAVIERTIFTMMFKHIHDTTHWHNNHTTNKEGTKEGNNKGNDGGNDGGRPGTVSGIVSVSVPVNCELYFNVLKEMAPNYFQFISNDKNAMTSIVTSLLNAIRICQTESTTTKPPPATATASSSVMTPEKSGSTYLIGTLNLLSLLLKHDRVNNYSSLLNNDSYIQEVYYNYLYSVPTIASQKSWPLCREKQEREAAFNVLYQLTAGIDQYNSLIALMNIFQSTISLDKIGWNIISKNSGRKKSKYTGLVNQGCTCYQNATLQQLYLIEEIREGVLNAPLSPLLLRQKRVLINFETYIQSRQPMTYQQLQNYIKSLQ